MLQEIVTGCAVARQLVEGAVLGGRGADPPPYLVGGILVGSKRSFGFTEVGEDAGAAFASMVDPADAPSTGS